MIWLGIGAFVWWAFWTAGTLRVLKIRDGYVELADFIGWLLVAWIAAPCYLIIQLVYWIIDRPLWKRRVL